MGRPPCCDKVGIKKGPWTPEEDIILVSYIQEHGPGNWRSVPTNTGLLRCSKSCRLRWTNYLRPGIKRGNFTPHEEGMIIHLQALLGNKWAAIASYLPQRTDNDIKNYWNTHLKKKLKKLQSAAMDLPEQSESGSCQFESKCFNDKRAVAVAVSCSSEPPSLGGSKASSTYASSAENISRLLQGWMRSSPTAQHPDDLRRKIDRENSTAGASDQPQPKLEPDGGELVSGEEFDSILSFENLKNVNSWDKSTPSYKDGEENVAAKQRSENAPPLSFLEKWLFEDGAAGQVEEMMELSPVF